MPQSYRLLTILLFSFAFIAPAWAEPELDVTLSSNSISLEERTTLTVEIQWPKSEAQYTFAFPNLTLNNLSIQKWGEGQEIFIQNGEEWTLKTFTVILEPVEVGPASIAGFELPYLEPASQKGGRFTVERQDITVTKPPFRFNLWTLLYLLPIPVAIFFLLAVRKKKIKEPKTKPVSKEELVIQQIEELQTTYQPKDLIAPLSSLLRHYMAEHYGLKKAQVMDIEILEAMKQSGAAGGEINALKRILDRLHEAKFTGTLISERESSELTREIIRLIEGKKVIHNP